MPSTPKVEEEKQLLTQQTIETESTPSSTPKKLPESAKSQLAIERKFQSRFDEIPNFIVSSAKKEKKKSPLSHNSKKHYLQRGQGKGGGKGYHN